MSLIFQKKGQRPQRGGFMRVQCSLKAEAYRKLAILSGSGSMAGLMTRLIEEEYARTQTPQVIAQRKAETDAHDAVHRSVMAALTGASRAQG